MKQLHLFLFLITILLKPVYAQEKPVLVVSKGHHQSITCIDISPDGKTIISGAADNLVKVYDMYMKQELNTLTEHTREVDRVRFSHDGKHIVSTSSYQLLIHAHPAGNLVHEIPLKNLNGNYTLHVSSKNEIYIGDGKGTRVYDIETGKLNRTIAIPSKNFVILKDEQTIVSKVVFHDGQKGVGFHSMHDEKLQDSIIIDNLLLEDFSISENGKKIALAISPGKIGVIDVKSKSVQRVFDTGRGIQNFIRLNKDGSQLITSGYDNSLIFWDVKSGEKLRDIKDISPSGDPYSMSLSLRDVALTDDDELIAFCYSDILDGKQKYTVEWFNFEDLTSVGKHAGDVKVSLSIGIDHTGTILSTGTIGDAIGVKCIDLTKASQKAYIPGTAYLGTGGEYLAAINNSDNAHRKLEIYQMPGIDIIRSYDIFGFASVKLSRLGRYAAVVDEKYIGANNPNPNTPMVTPFIRVFDIELDKEIVHIEKTLLDHPTTLIFSGDEKYLYLIYPEKIETLDLKTQQIIRTNEVKVHLDFNNPTTPDGKHILSTNNKFVQGIDVISGEVIDLLSTGDMNFPITSNFSHDYKYIGVSILKANVAKPNRVQVYEWETKTLVCELIGHNDIVRQLTFDNKNEHLYSVDDNGVILMWDLAECKSKASFLAFGADDYIIQSPEGYYKASKGNIASIGFRQNGSLYTFDQFDLRYNRPDKVLEALGMATDEQISMYHRAYQKRMSRMGFKNNFTSSKNLHAPKIEILNSKTIPLKTSTNEISIQVKAVDELLNLDRLNVVVNGVPIYGRLGRSLKSHNAKTFQESLKIPLNIANNQVQISVMNTDGTESLRKSFSIICEKKVSKPNLHIIALGVKKYKDSSMNLTYSDKDAIDFANLFDKNSNELFSSINTTVLTNEQVTKENVIKLREDLLKTNVDDQVILYYSGHGLLNEDFDYFLSTYDVNFVNPDEKGLPFDNFKGLIDAIPARNRLILMDACHSGEIDKDEIAFVPSEEVEDKKLVTKSFNAKGFKTIGLENSFELMKELFVELRKESGSTIIASSAGKEYSLESNEWKNGVFTFALKEGLLNHKADKNKDNLISVTELKLYLFNRVKELTNGDQTPTVRRENLQQDSPIY